MLISASVCLAAIDPTSFTVGKGISTAHFPFEGTNFLRTSLTSSSHLLFIFHQSLFPSTILKMGFSMELTPYTATMGGMTGLPLQFAVATIATCAFWLFGYDMSV
jgi:hypothetical protein